MREIERISDQLNRAFAGNAWHGPSVKEALDGVDAALAASRRLPGAHTIWELANHIGAWADIVRRTIQGEKVEVTAELNFPPVNETTEEAWTGAKQKLNDIHAALVGTAATLAEARLDEPAVEGSSSVYALLHGVAQHYVYHAGQIVLLKKS
jgi:uncharacterized damage-inducible protein DinB